MTQTKNEPERLPLPSCTCRRCSRHLTNPTSVNHGFGPACYKKRMSGDPRQSKKLDPCTIVSKDLARKVFQAIYRIISRMDPDLTPRWKCNFCGTTIDKMPLESMDHDTGSILPGFGKPQWIILHDEHNDLAIWKIGITDDAILSEMEAHGDIPEGWTRQRVT